jgi:hypothetical protein
MSNGTGAQKVAIFWVSGADYAFVLHHFKFCFADSNSFDSVSVSQYIVVCRAVARHWTRNKRLYNIRS